MCEDTIEKTSVPSPQESAKEKITCQETENL